MAAADYDDVEFLGVEHWGKVPAVSSEREREAAILPVAACHRGTQGKRHPGCCGYLVDNGFLTFPAVHVPSAVDLICATLRGEKPAWPWGLDIAATERFRSAVAVHGVGPLLHAQAAGIDWPLEVLQIMREQAVQQAMWELRHQQLLSEVIACLAAAGVEPVLIKGTALAYSLYPDAGLRTRADTDMIIPPAARDQVHALLQSAGFVRNTGVSGEFVSYQANYTRCCPGGGTHALDLHWRINNSELLSHLFTYEELRHHATSLPLLCLQARAASRVHAMLLACMHRSTHKQNPYRVDGAEHHTADRLIWLYDIHLLAQDFGQQEWNEFVRLAENKGLRAVCLDGMRQARSYFHTVLPESTLAALARPAPREKPAIYLEGSALRQQYMDFLALGSFARRSRFLRELLFPPRDYIRAKFPAASERMLPWLYLRRSWSGVARRIARTKKG